MGKFKITESLRQARIDVKSWHSEDSNSIEDGIDLLYDLCEEVERLENILKVLG